MPRSNPKRTINETQSTNDVYCNECGEGMRWGDEYPDPRGGVSDDDHDALCADCWHEIATEGVTIFV